MMRALVAASFHRAFSTVRHGLGALVRQGVQEQLATLPHRTRWPVPGARDRPGRLASAWKTLRLPAEPAREPAGRAGDRVERRVFAATAAAEDRSATSVRKRALSPQWRVTEAKSAGSGSPVRQVLEAAMSAGFQGFCLAAEAEAEGKVEAEGRAEVEAVAVVAEEAEGRAAVHLLHRLCPRLGSPSVAPAGAEAPEEPVPQVELAAQAARAVLAELVAARSKYSPSARFESLARTSFGLRQGLLEQAGR